MIICMASQSPFWTPPLALYHRAGILNQNTENLQKKPNRTEPIETSNRLLNGTGPVFKYV